MPKQTFVKYLTWIARLLAYLTIAIVVVLLVALVPVNIKNVQADWTINQSYRAVDGLASLQAYANYVIVLRYLAAGVILVTVAILLWSQPRRGMPLLAAVMLASLIISFNLSGPLENVPYPAPWGQILELLAWILFINGFFLLFLFIYLFPNGRFEPRWAAIIAPLTLPLFPLGFLLLFAGIGDEGGWFALLILTLAILLMGLTSLVLRYRQTQEQGQRQRIRPVLLALLFFVGLLLLDFFGGGWGERYPAWAVVSMHLELGVTLILPLSILWSISRHQLWGIDLRPQLRGLLAVASAALLVIVLSGFTILRLDTAKQEHAQAETAALLGKPVGALIVDTDMGNDDVLALLFLMQHPGVDLQAVTVVGTGLVHCAPGIRNVHGLLELTQYPEIPVSCGTEEPLDAEHPFPEDWRNAADRLWGLNLPLNDRQPSPLAAPDLLIELLNGADQPLTFLALGPLTNLAQAFQSHPEVIEKIDRLYIMGGAVEASGNVYDPGLGFDNQTAEWNIYADPLAAAIVFESGVPITLVPLDATNYVPVNMTLFQRLQQQHLTRAATFTFNVFYINQGWIQTGKYYLWDTLTAAVLTAGEIAEYEDYTLQVVTERGPDFGRTKASAEGAAVRVTTWANTPLFEELFLRVMNRE